MTIYDETVKLTSNLFAVRLNYKWGIINVNRQIIIPAVNDFICMEGKNIFIRHGIDTNVIPVEWLSLNFDFIFEFSIEKSNNKYAKVLKNNKFGIVDKDFNGSAAKVRGMENPIQRY